MTTTTPHPPDLARALATRIRDLPEQALADLHKVVVDERIRRHHEPLTLGLADPTNSPIVAKETRTESTANNSTRYSDANPYPHIHDSHA